MNTSQEHTILRLIIFQIFTIYYQSKNDSLSSYNFYFKAIKECKDAKDTCLLVIPMPEPATKKVGEHCIVPTNKAIPLVNQPLKVEVIFLVSEATKNFSTSDIHQSFSNLLATVLKDCKSALNITKTGWLNFHRNIVGVVYSLGRDEDALMLIEQQISFHENALQQSVKTEENHGENQEKHEDALAQSYWEKGDFQCRRGNLTDAITSFRRALDSRVKLFGEEHYKTAESYHSVGVTQHSLSDYTAALESAKRALDIRIKLFGEEHPETADSFHSVGVTQHSLGDYTSALESKKRALDIRIKLFGEEHPKTADSYHEVGVIQQ